MPDNSEDDVSRRVMALLEAGSPLTLLFDLVTAPNSSEILLEEGRSVA